MINNRYRIVLLISEIARHDQALLLVGEYYTLHSKKSVKRNACANSNFFSSYNFILLKTKQN